MTGHIRRRGKRSFELKFDTGADPATGQRLTKYVSFKGTRRDAELELARLIAAASKGEHVDQSKTTLSEFLDRWDRDWAAVNVSPKTLERYRGLIINRFGLALEIFGFKSSVLCTSMNSTLR